MSPGVYRCVRSGGFTAPEGGARGVGELLSVSSRALFDAGAMRPSPALSAQVQDQPAYQVPQPNSRSCSPVLRQRLVSILRCGSGVAGRPRLVLADDGTDWECRPWPYSTLVPLYRSAGGSKGKDRSASLGLPQRESAEPSERAASLERAGSREDPSPGHWKTSEDYSGDATQAGFPALADRDCSFCACWSARSSPTSPVSKPPRRRLWCRG